MKKNRCDICQQDEPNEYYLTTLYEKYKTKDIKHVCPDCTKRIVDINLKLMQAVAHLKDNWLKKIINRMRNKP